MLENYWRKRLTDGSFEIGSDSDVNFGRASWTRGHQNITEVRICCNGVSVELVCSPKNDKLAEWKQLDNFCFNPATGKSTLLSRQISCSINGYTRLRQTRDMAYIYKFNRFELNDVWGDPVPNNANLLVCTIGIDGRVSYKWS